jgi:site-specific recombinase XerC
MEQEGTSWNRRALQGTAESALLMLDCGLRISEVLGLPYENCDFDNLVEEGKGKGAKHPEIGKTSAANWV